MVGSRALLSRILFGGQALWEESGRNQTWRRKVCEDTAYYETDSAARKKELMDGVLAALGQSNLTTPEVGVFATLGQSTLTSLTGAGPLSNALDWVTNDTHIAVLCRNEDALIVTGCPLGSFLALVAVMLLAYYITGRTKRDKIQEEQDASKAGCCSACTWHFSEWLESFFGMMPEWLPAVGLQALALLGLGLYLAGLVTEIQVIVKVWNLWSAYVLLAIFSWHHMYRGLIVSFYLLRVSSETPVLKSNGAEFSELPEGNSNASIESVADSSTVEGDKFRWTCLHIVLALIWSPLVMLLTFALDIWSFFDAFGVPSLPLLNVESYSDMRVVLLPALQSLYSAAITTYMFLEGNNPRSGIFTTRFLYMRAVFFACCLAF